MLTRGMVVTRCSRGESREKMTKRISHCVFIVQKYDRGAEDNARKEWCGEP